MLVCLAALAFTAVRAPFAQRVLRPLELLGRTALFYYVLHAHLMGAFALLTDTRRAFGIDGALLGAIACLLLLYPACIAYDRYKRAHPDGWTRFLSRLVPFSRDECGWAYRRECAIRSSKRAR